jgi:hypothetical protein
MISRTRTVQALCALLFSFAMLAMAPARADYDYSDIWYEGAAAGGWGVTFTQNDYAIFTTFFVFDASHKPTWFGGTMVRSTDGNYSGTLYTVAGDYYGDTPYNPADNAYVQAGTMSFVATDISHGTLTYTVNGVTVNKTIQRQPLVPFTLTGNYYGVYTYGQTAACTGGSGAGYNYIKLVLTQTTNPQELAIQFVNPSDGVTVQCTMAGAYTQAGQVMDLASASYTCQGTTRNPVHVYDLRVLSNGGIAFNWLTVAGPACIQSGIMSAIHS